MNKLILSYETTLPSHLYPYLRRLFSIQRFYINKLIKEYWRKEWIEKLYVSQNVWKILDKATERPEHIPSRVWRNICAEAGSLLKASYKRIILTEELLKKKELIDAPFWKAAKELKVQRLFIENIQAQIKNFRKKIRRLPEDFFELGVPEYRGIEFTTEADDSIHNGQFKKLKLEGNCYSLKIKLPIFWKKWGWFKIKQNLPEKVVLLLKEGAQLKAPCILRRRRKCGKEYYTLKFILELEVERTAPAGKILGVDLSPSENRIAVCVVHNGKNYSKPIYLSAKRLIAKALRIQKETDRLEHKIDEAYRRKDFSRIKHLFGEQKRKRKKLKAIRKQILEVFTKELILLAKQNCCYAIAVEDLSGIKVPDWKDKVLRYLFSSWFHGKVVERLRQKALRNGIKVVLVNPKNTSRKCHVCGTELSGRGLYLRCEKCGKLWDRDYNASVNITKRALNIFESRGKPEGLDSEGVRQREPSRLTLRLQVEAVSKSRLLAWLQVVRVSLFAHMIRNRKLSTGKR